MSEVKDEVLEKSKIQKWCEVKHKKITDDLMVFFEQYKGKLNSINIYPIISKILGTDNSIMKLKDREFDEAEDVETCFEAFKDIMATINLNVVYIPSQQSFCMFMGWTDRIYKKMLNSSTEDIQDMMQLINEYLIECQASAGQSGFAKQNLTKFRMQMAGDHGHNLVTQKEQNEDDRSRKTMKSKDELIKKLKDMGAKGPTVENAEKLIK